MFAQDDEMMKMMTSDIIIMPNQVFSISNALPTHDEGYIKKIKIVHEAE